jgi:hypothetical protein
MKAEGHDGMRFTFTPRSCRCSMAASTGCGRDGEGRHSRHGPVHDAYLADKVAERYPGLRLVLDHLGLKSAKDVSEATNFATLDKVLALAKRPNVAAKVSAMPCYAADKSYPYRSVHPQSAGFRRLWSEAHLLGNDWSRLPCTYRQGVTMFTEEMPLKGDDLTGHGPRYRDWIDGAVVWNQRTIFGCRPLLSLERASSPRQLGSAVPP